MPKDIYKLTEQLLKDFNPQDHMESLPGMDITYSGGLFIPGQLPPWNKGMTLEPFSKETRQKMSDARKGKPSPRKGATNSKETRQKISNSLKGKKHTEERNANKSEQMKRDYDNGTRVISKETRQKISKSRTGQRLSKEHRQKISDNANPWNKGKFLPDDQVSKQALYKRKWRERQRLLTT